MTATLEFRGLDLLSQLTDPGREGIRIHIVRGFLAPLDVRGSDYVVAARVGRSSGNRVSDVLKIGLAGYIVGATPESWRDFTNDLLAVLDENGQDPGALIARGPYLGMETGDVAEVAARVSNVIEGPIESKLRQTWSIELETIEAWTFTPGP